MLTFLAEHALLFKLLTILLVVSVALFVVWVSLPAGRSRYRALHRTWGWSTNRSYAARHAVPEHHPRHVAVAPAASAYLGRTPDGDLQLVDDEHTHELVGAAA